MTRPRNEAAVEEEEVEESDIREPIKAAEQVLCSSSRRTDTQPV